MSVGPLAPLGRGSEYQTRSPAAHRARLRLVIPLTQRVAAGWRAGTATIVISSVLVWRFVMGPADPAEVRAAVISMVLFWASGGVLVAFASAFRTSAQRIAAERQSQLDERDLLLKEFNHRIKNDFQTLSSVLQLQLRRAQDAPVKAALEALGPDKILFAADYPMEVQKDAVEELEAIRIATAAKRRIFETNPRRVFRL